MRKNYNPEDWEGLEDTPEEFEVAIQNATSDQERTFFRNLMSKVIHEPAFSNDVLMNDKDNEDGIYILRVSDDFIIGRKDTDGKDLGSYAEFGGLFFFLSQDMYPYLHRHITIGEWLRERNYSGIRYDANNDDR